MNRTARWLAWLLIALLPLQGLAAATSMLCPHHALAATAMADTDEMPPCHTEMAADEGDMTQAADATPGSGCAACAVCTIGSALPAAPAVWAGDEARPAPAAAPVVPHADAERRGLDRPPKPAAAV